MITTRMIAIEITDIGTWDDIGGIFALLHDTNRSYSTEITILTGYVPPTGTVHPNLVACVVKHLIHEDKPVAIVGQQGFEVLVAELWRKMPAELRHNFSFGFSFTPTDLKVSKANLVVVPSSCEVRWTGYRFRCDSRWNHTLDDSVAAFLSHSLSLEFQAFLKEIGLRFHSFSDYGRYTRLWRYWESRNENGPEESSALLRSLGTMIPNPDLAIPQKEEAMRIASRHLKDATIEEVLALRSVRANAFPTVGIVLGNAVCNWLASRIEALQVDGGVGLSKLILAVESSQSTEWQEWVRDGIKRAFANLSENVTRNFWLILVEERILTEIGSQLPANALSEKALIRTFPSTLPSTLYPQFETWCMDRGWMALMAKAAFCHLGFDRALHFVLKQDTAHPKTSAIEILCASTTPSQVWASAFKYNNLTLVTCAAAAAKTDPTLWIGAAPDLNQWAAILDTAAQAQPDFLRKVDITAVKARLFEAWDIGATISPFVCEALEQVGQLEFVAHSNRNRIWKKFPPQYLAKSLSNTLQMWLKDYYLTLPSNPELEVELVDILFSPQHRESTFPRNSHSLGVGGLLLVEKWGTEFHFESWLNAIGSSTTKLKSDVAKQAGALVKMRDWAALARYAKECDERFGRSDFREIWQGYYHSLGPLEKLWFNYSPRIPSRSTNPLPSAKFTHMIDAVFVTALPEEFSAVCSHLLNTQEHVENGSIYQVGQFNTNKIECTVAVVQTGMGNSLSAAATERALNLFKPSFAFFVGIAGGLRDDLKIGDVVAASKVHGYEGGKSGANFKPRPEAPSISHEAEQRANAVLRDRAWLKRIIPTPTVEPDAYVRPIASGEKVLVSESSEDLKRVRAIYTDAYAVAMEEIGFAAAARVHTSVCFAVVRSISDLIENKQEADQSGSHEVAARNAAAFAFEMLAGLMRARQNHH
jgi:nucleoside phosphorylase